MMRFIFIIMIGGVLGLAGAAPAGTNTLDWAPLLSRDTDVQGNARWRVLGPLFETKNAANSNSLWAVHPLISTVQIPSDQRMEREILWPVLAGRGHRDFWQWRMAILGLWRDYDVTDPDSRYSLWFLPVYFQGRSKQRDPYFAVFPLGGKISEILLWDEVQFALFPLYGHGKIGDIDTYTYLWPVLATSHGEEVAVRRAFIFPLYGYSFRQDAYDKRFFLWPFWTQARYAYPRSHGFGWILFPLIGHIKLTDQESWMFFPPFTRFSRGTQMNQINCPWPIFQYGSGAIEKLYFWPVVGYKVIGDIQTAFLFWPLGTSSRRVTPKGINQRYFFVPIFYSETLTRQAPTGSAQVAAPRSGEAGNATRVMERTLKLWPLFSYRRAGTVSRFRFPSLCPAKDFEVIDRNYAVLWTLYTHAVAGDVTEDELLWGWFQYRRSSAGMLKTTLFPVFSVEQEKDGMPVEWSLLKGLIGRERDGQRNRIRLLYVFRW